MNVRISKINTLEYLSQYADIAIYFANPNIHPKNEYLRRAKVQLLQIVLGLWHVLSIHF
jgi:predicted adenine nucleotide alpha hydrolase (AANH) superfamily ATPase